MAAPQASVASAPLLFFALAGPVIDFLEQLVVLADLRVVRVQFERFLVGLSGLVELPFVLVGNRQVVVGGDVGRVELGGLLPAIDGFAPQTALRDADAELDLRTGVAARVGERRRR